MSGFAHDSDLRSGRSGETGFHPQEVGHYIPAATGRTAKRCAGGAARCQGVIQTNNVDDRGYIYIVDRAGTGMHIPELTGAARAIAAFK
jgi:hypothetical protein